MSAGRTGSCSFRNEVHALLWNSGARIREGETCNIRARLGEFRRCGSDSRYCQPQSESALREVSSSSGLVDCGSALRCPTRCRGLCEISRVAPRCVPVRGRKRGTAGSAPTALSGSNERGRAAHVSVGFVSSDIRRDCGCSGAARPAVPAHHCREASFPKSPIRCLRPDKSCNSLNTLGAYQPVAWPQVHVS